eukprot:1198290-Amphidinium_carterae.6
MSLVDGPSSATTHDGVCDEQLLHSLALPSVPCIVRCQRLACLQRVTLADNELLRSVFAITCEGSLWNAWIQDLGQIHSHHSLRHLPEPCVESISVWLQHIILSRAKWKKDVREALLPRGKFNFDEFRQARRGPLRVIEVEEQEMHPDVAGAPVAPIPDGGTPDPVELAVAQQLTCHICNRQFDSRVGLSAHKRRFHKLHPPLATRLSSTSCPTCKAQLGTRTRVLKHLHECLGCALQLVANTDPMDVADYEQQVKEMNGWDDLHSRSQLPRSGPIPVLDGVPTSQGVAPIDYRNVAAEVASEPTQH